MKRDEKKPLLTRRYDLAGNGILHIFQHQATARCVPMGNYRGGAGFKCLVVFTVLHYLGAPFFYVLIRFERQVHSLYLLKERLSVRGKKIKATEEEREG